MMYSILSDYNNLDSEYTFAIVPVRKLRINEKMSFENNVSIYPGNKVDKNELTKYNFYNFEFEKVKSDFFDSTLVVVPLRYKCSKYPLSNNPIDTMRILAEVLTKSEEVVNIFNYIFLNFVNVSDLPQRAGYITGEKTGILYYEKGFGFVKYMEEKYLINTITVGKDFEVDVKEKNNVIRRVSSNLLGNDTEISNILKHALILYSKILYSSSSTSKFMQAMTLIDYLGNPFEYQKMQKNKKSFAAFSASNEWEYNEICERFKFLTSKTDENGNQIGLRTNIIHNGMVIESLVENLDEVSMVLQELQKYICNFINGIIDLSNKNEWRFVEEKVESVYERVVSVKEVTKSEKRSGICMIIDFDFLNEAIKEVYYIFSHLELPELVFEDFLELLFQQSHFEKTNGLITVKIVASRDQVVYGTNNLNIKAYNNKKIKNSCGDMIISVEIYDESYQEKLKDTFEKSVSEVTIHDEENFNFNKIVFVSDNNLINYNIMERVRKSYKKVILIRLDDSRTKYCDSIINSKYFDVTYLIMILLGIPLHEIPSKPLLIDYSED